MKKTMKPVDYPLAPDLTITVGDRVRSFDFPMNAECYWVGTVIGFTNHQQYEIKVEYQVWEGKKENINFCEKIYAPKNGISGIFGPMRGVQRVLAGEED